MVQSPDHSRDRSREPSHEVRVFQGIRPRPGGRRRVNPKVFGLESLERRELLASGGWRVWPGPSSGAFAPNWSTSVAGTADGAEPSEEAVATALIGLDASIKAALDAPVATTHERVAVRDGLLAIRVLAHPTAVSPPTSSTVAEQVARLKADILELSRGRSLPNESLADRLVAEIDAVVASLRFTADDLAGHRIDPAPASSGSQAPALPDVTVTPTSGLPTIPTYSTWRTFLARPA